MDRVLIGALGAELGGSIRHLSNLLPRLAEADGKRHYVVLVRENFPEINAGESVVIERLGGRIAQNWAGRLLFDLRELPRRVGRERFAALVSILNTGPLAVASPHILFQRNSLFFCRHYLDTVRGRAAVETLLRRRLAIRTMQGADLVVTPSEAMAEMIRQSCPALAAKRFSVLPHGYERSGMAAELDPPIAAILEKGTGPRLLYPTHPAPHKGFPLLFDALALLRGRGVPVRLFTTVEPADWPREVARYERQIERLGLVGSVFFLGRVPQAQMGAVYSACDMMVYPSLCESFGFSMVEAMGHDLPIVAAGTGINQEICADAALYYEPLDATGCAQRIVEALDDETRTRLVANGRARLAGSDWSWTRYARDFAGLVDQVC